MQCWICVSCRKRTAFVCLKNCGSRRVINQIKCLGRLRRIWEEVKNGKKLAGICLGMQALYEVSEENGHIPALGLLPGRIVHFPEGKLKVPHMGWNELVIHRPHEVLEGLPLHSYVYFVHSYYKTPGNTGDVIASADYGVTVPAVVGKDNVLGFQFHPEKSGSVGMAIWDRLAKWLMK